MNDEDTPTTNNTDLIELAIGLQRLENKIDTIEISASKVRANLKRVVEKIEKLIDRAED